jgi:hypothetical protein
MAICHYQRKRHPGATTSKRGFVRAFYQPDMLLELWQAVKVKASLVQKTDLFG